MVSGGPGKSVRSEAAEPEAIKARCRKVSGWEGLLGRKEKRDFFARG